MLIAISVLYIRENYIAENIYHLCVLFTHFVILLIKNEMSHNKTELVEFYIAKEVIFRRKKKICN